MTDIGQALRLARERRELTQTQVMGLTGINNKTLSGYENGVAEPDLQTLATLLRLYQVSADQLLHLTGGPPPADEEHLLALYRQLPPAQRQELLLVLDTLLAHRRGAAKRGQGRPAQAQGEPNF